MIYIVRHGETDWNKEERIMGRRDIPLNDIGKNQAKEVADKLKDIDFDVVFCSPLQRCRETAKIICPNKEIILDERLVERSNGDLEGMLKEDIIKLPEFNNPSETKYNIESLDHLHARITSFFKDVDSNYRGQNVLIITHGGVSINIRSIFEGEPSDGNYQNYRLGNCEVLTYSND